jgi:hypothetical protein
MLGTALKKRLVNHPLPYKRGLFFIERKVTVVQWRGPSMSYISKIFRVTKDYSKMSSL